MPFASEASFQEVEATRPLDRRKLFSPVSPANEISDMVLYTGKPQRTREENPVAKNKQSPLDKIIDKAQEKRRGGKARSFLDKAI